jgi:transposase-like protein
VRRKGGDGSGRVVQRAEFTAGVILWAVRWYLQFPISYRALELMLQDRGVSVDHTTVFRWIQAYAPELDKRLRPHLRLSNGSWRVDETYVKVKGRWTYLYRAVDSRGQTIDFLLSAKRDAEAATRFFRKALGQPHTVNPRTITVDKNPAYPKAAADMKTDGELWRRSRLRQVKYLNNIVEQDHRRIKRLVRPGGLKPPSLQSCLQLPPNATQPRLSMIGRRRSTSNFATEPRAVPGPADHPGGATCDRPPVSLASPPSTEGVLQASR